MIDVPNDIAIYYLDELEDWDWSIKNYKDEIGVFIQKLEAMIHRNTILGIAEKVGIQ